MLARRRQPRPIHPPAAAPGVPLGAHQAPEVARRSRVSRRARQWQEPLGRDAPVGRGQLLAHDVDGDGGVVTALGPRRRTLLLALDHAPHGLMRGAAEVGRGAVTAEVTVRGEDVHAISGRLHDGVLRSGCGVLRQRHHRRPGDVLRSAHRLGRNGDFSWPRVGTFTWPRAVEAQDMLAGAAAHEPALVADPPLRSPQLARTR